MRNSACANFDLWHSLRFCTLISEKPFGEGINDGQTLEGTVVPATEVGRDAATRGGSQPAQGGEFSRYGRAPSREAIGYDEAGSHADRRTHRRWLVQRSRLSLDGQLRQTLWPQRAAGTHVPRHSQSH